MDLPVMQATRRRLDTDRQHQSLHDSGWAVRALASRPGYGSGQAGAHRHSRSGPAGLYGTHLSAIPIAVMKRGRSSCFRSRTEGDPEQDYFADGVAEESSPGAISYLEYAEPGFKEETNMSELRYPNESRDYRDVRDLLLKTNKSLSTK